MSGKLYNNIGICALGIGFTLNHLKVLSLSRAILITPIIAHRALLQYMARKTTALLSVEQLIIRNPEYFVNFNSRFYDGLTVSVNAIQFLYEMRIIDFKEGNINLQELIEYDKAMGERARKIFDASPNIAKLVNSDLVTLYSNLRIKL